MGWLARHGVIKEMGRPHRLGVGEGHRSVCSGGLVCGLRAKGRGAGMLYGCAVLCTRAEVCAERWSFMSLAHNAAPAALLTSMIPWKIGISSSNLC